MQKRQEEIDFLKCVMIILMVMFHLTYVEELYPAAKEIVFTFHMPVFLLISGYFAAVSTSFEHFRTRLWRIIWPYALAETAYCMMSAFMPVKMGIEHLSVAVVATKVLLQPLGPYWYLHTLILCNVICYVAGLLPKVSSTSRTLIAIGFIFVLYQLVGIISLSSAIFFSVGLLMRQLGASFTSVFPTSLFAFPLAVWLCLYPTNLHSDMLTGLAITYLTVGGLLALSTHLSKVRHVFFIGRNTLPILLFSPIFTMAVKPLRRVLQFDASGILFCLLATAICVEGSVALAWGIDKLRLSKWVFGKERIISKEF